MGLSKLVTHSQTRLLGNALNVANRYQITDVDRVAIPVPMAHMYGFGAAFLSAFAAGANIEVQDRFNVLKYLDLERRFKPTIAWVTPMHCEMLLKAYRTPRTGYRLIVTSGQRISESLMRAFDAQVSTVLVNQYGSSELGAVAACNPTSPIDEKVMTIGTPFPGVHLQLEHEPPAASGDPGTNVGAGTPAGLSCRHPFSFLGYVDDDGHWLKKQDEYEAFQTGDLARVLPDGNLQVVGRVGQSVNRRGYLIQLAELEQRLELIPGVAQVITVRLAGDGAQGDGLAAFVTAAFDNGLTADDVRQRCVGVIPAYAIPDAIFVLEQMPLLASGKIDRQKLMAQAFGG